MVNSPEVNSFTFFKSYYEAGKFMPDNMRHEFLESILEYAFEGKEPNCERVDPALMAAFALVRPNIENSLKNARNGAKGGSAKKGDGRSGEARKPARKPASDRAASDKDKDWKKDKETDGKADKKEDEDKDGRGGEPREGPPTLESVTAFVEAEEDLTFDADEFYNYYAARGWRLSGGSPVADWRALARSWQSKEGSFGRVQKEEATVDEGIYSVFD